MCKVAAVLGSPRSTVHRVRGAVPERPWGVPRTGLIRFSSPSSATNNQHENECSGASRSESRQGPGWGSERGTPAALGLPFERSPDGGSDWSAGRCRASLLPGRTSGASSGHQKHLRCCLRCGLVWRPGRCRACPGRGAADLAFCLKCDRADPEVNCTVDAPPGEKSTPVWSSAAPGDRSGAACARGRARRRRPSTGLPPIDGRSIEGVVVSPMGSEGPVEHGPAPREEPRGTTAPEGPNVALSSRPIPSGRRPPSLRGEGELALVSYSKLNLDVTQ